MTKVWLASYPRSGNTLYRLVLNLALGYPTYSKYDDDVIRDSGIGELLGHAKWEDHLDIEGVPQFVKTHDLPEQADFHKAIYIMRDGRDALVSHARYMHRYELPDHSYEDLLRGLIIGNTWGGWSGNVMAWTTRPNTVVVTYEQLIRDPIGQTLNSLFMAGYLHAYNVFEMPGFEVLHDRWPDFFRVGRPGAWVDEMSADLQALFWDRHGKAMIRTGYSIQEQV